MTKEQDDSKLHILIAEDGIATLKFSLYNRFLFIYLRHFKGRMNKYREWVVPFDRLIVEDLKKFFSVIEIFDSRTNTTKKIKGNVKYTDLDFDEIFLGHRDPIYVDADIIPEFQEQRGRMIEFMGLRIECSVKEIKKAYRKLCRQCHPDCGGKAEDFIKLQNSYEDLLVKLNRRSR